MCFQRDCLSHETVETLEYDEYSAGWIQASAHIGAGPRKRDGNLHQPVGRRDK